MALTDLKAAVSTVIKTNGNQEITGSVLQSTLNSIIDQVGSNATFKGVATPSTNPGTPDAPVFYLVTQPGVYANFGITINTPGIYAIHNSSGSFVLSDAGVPLLKQGELVRPMTLTTTRYALSDIVLGIFDIVGNYSRELKLTEFYYTGGIFKFYVAEGSTLVSTYYKSEDINTVGIKTIQVSEYNSGGLSFKLLVNFDLWKLATLQAGSFSDQVIPLHRLNNLKSGVLPDLVYGGEPDFNGMTLKNFKIRDFESNSSFPLARTDLKLKASGRNKFDKYKAVVGKTIYGTSPWYSFNFAKGVALFGINIKEYAGTQIQISGLPAYNISGGYGRYWVVRNEEGTVIANGSSGSTADPLLITLPPLASTLDVDMVHNNIDGYDYSGCFIGPSGSAYEETVYLIDSYLDTLIFTPELINYKGVENATIEEVILKNIYDQSLVQIGKEVYGDGTIKEESKSAIFKFPVSTSIDSAITVSRLPIYTGFYRYYTIWGDESGSIVLATGQKPNNVDNFSLTLPEGSKYVVFSVYQRVADATLPSIAGIQIEYGYAITDYVSTKIPDLYSMLFKKNETSVVLSNKPESTIDILIFGDSITETDTITYNNDPANPYTTAISKWIRSNWPTFVYNQKSRLLINEFRNYAKSGASIRDRDIEDRQYLGFQIDEAIADLNPPAGSYYYGKTFSPDVIVISLGTNDGPTASTYESAMSKTIADGTGGVDVDLTMANLDQKNSFSEAFRHSLMKLRKQFPNAVYIYMTPIQRYSYEQPDSLMTVSKQIASRFGCIICDTYNESGIVRDFQKSDGSSGDLYDGLHPNVNGQRKMARTIANKIIDNTTWIY